MVLFRWSSYHLCCWKDTTILSEWSDQKCLIFSSFWDNFWRARGAVQSVYILTRRILLICAPDICTIHTVPCTYGPSRGELHQRSTPLPEHPPIKPTNHRTAEKGKSQKLFDIMKKGTVNCCFNYLDGFFTCTCSCLCADMKIKNKHNIHLKQNL